MNIYPIKMQMLSLKSLLESGNADEESIGELLKSTGLEFNASCIQTAIVLKNLELTIEALKKAEKELKEKRKALKNNIEKTKEKILSSMLEVGVNEITHEEGIVNIKIKTCTAHVDVPEGAKIQEDHGEFFLCFDCGEISCRYPVLREHVRSKQIFELDKKKILESLKAGIDVPFFKLERTKKIDIL